MAKFTNFDNEIEFFFYANKDQQTILCKLLEIADITKFC